MNQVEPTVGREEETAARIERNVMRVGARLPLIAVWADFAPRRDHVGEGRERSVRIDREHRHSRPVADDDVTVARVRRQVRRIISIGRLLVQKREPSARLVDRVGTHFGAVAVDRIEESPRPIERDELRVGHGLERLQERPGTVPIDPVDADAFSLRFASRAGETSDIGE